MGSLAKILHCLVKMLPAPKNPLCCYVKLLRSHNKIVHSLTKLLRSTEKPLNSPTNLLPPSETLLHSPKKRPSHLRNVCIFPQLKVSWESADFANVESAKVNVFLPTFVSTSSPL